MQISPDHCSHAKHSQEMETIFFWGGGTATEGCLDRGTTALICYGRARLSDVEVVKGLICTNSTVSCGPVKYC